MDFSNLGKDRIGVMKNEKENMKSWTIALGIQLSHETGVTGKKWSLLSWLGSLIQNHKVPSIPADELDQPVIVSNEAEAIAREAAADEWQDNYDRRDAISRISSYYPPGHDYDELSSSTLYQAVCDNDWESLPTSILVRWAELQFTEDERSINAMLAKHNRI